MKKFTLSLIGELSFFIVAIVTYLLSSCIFNTLLPNSLQILLVGIPVIFVTILIHAVLEVRYVKNLLEYYRYYKNDSFDVTHFNILLKRYKKEVKRQCI